MDKKKQNSVKTNHLLVLVLLHGLHVYTMSVSTLVTTINNRMFVKSDMYFYSDTQTLTTTLTFRSFFNVYSSLNSVDSAGTGVGPSHVMEVIAQRLLDLPQVKGVIISTIVGLNTKRITIW